MLPNVTVNNSRDFRRLKYRTRAFCRASAFLAVFAFFAFTGNYVAKHPYGAESQHSAGPFTSTSHRRLLQNPAIAPSPAGPQGAAPTPDKLDQLIIDNARDGLTRKEIEDGGVLLYILGIVYMFIGLAIVCDEFFVPALEIVSDRLNISPEVSGATLMAAGGSAPELFTSFIGTFQESSIGFGTIVGSAVFNVLFVIAMCALFSKEVLSLTWWPLFRDSIYYSISLGVLALFFSTKENVVGKGVVNTITWWEATILFVMYIGYCVLMKFHVRIHNCIETTCLKKKKAEEEDKFDGVELANAGAASGAAAGEGTVVAATKGDGYRKASFNQPSTFRAGVLQLMLSDKPMLETAGVHIVHQIQGSAEEVFNKIDTDGNGYLDKNEFKNLLESMGSQVSDGQVVEAMEAIDEDGDGKINFMEFQRWYLRSETRIQTELKEAFKAVDSNSNGKICKEELRKLLSMMKNAYDDETVDTCFTALDDNGDGWISEQEFLQWYSKSDLWQQAKTALEEEADEAEGLTLHWPEGVRAQILYILLLPLTVPLYYGNPDHGPGHRTLGWGLFGFTTAIFWIGGFSYLMVWWTEIVGATFGISDVVMGLTFLAAGTSVPDLLSSVIVARQGKGDMAVSSSLGSNIFDVLVGLPVPWIAYTIMKHSQGELASVVVQAKDVHISILILIGMLVCVIGTVAACGWKMTKLLGITMLLMYVVFVVQDVLRAS